MTGVQTILFTDIAGSTELLDRLGDELADTLTREHLRLMRQVLRAHDGREVKSLGDGLMVTFASAVDALRCAVAMQRAEAERPGSVPLSIRIGVDVGEPIYSDGDLHGTPVVVAKRLCDSAGAGEILISELVMRLLGNRFEHPSQTAGEIMLKGLSAPITAYRVSWKPPDPASAPQPGAARPRSPAAVNLGAWGVSPTVKHRQPGSGQTVSRTAAREAHPSPSNSRGLPRRLADAASHPLVGRERELARLRAAWPGRQGHRSGHPTAVLLAGEAGIGKTRLMAEFAETVRGRGAAVLYGGCDDALRLPYQPFVEALGTYLDETTHPVKRTHVERGALARLLPGRGDTQGALENSAAPWPQSDRYLLFAGVRGVLAGIAAQYPTLLILDDLHWADRDTLLLIRYLLTSATLPNTLIGATYRPTELGADDPLTELLAALHREPGVDRFALEGLTEREVGGMMLAHGGGEVQSTDVAFSRALTTATNGNPFFVGELVRDLSESGELAGAVAGAGESFASGLEVPGGVRETIGYRVGRMEQEVRQVLDVAAVVGRDFEVVLLARVLGWDEDQVSDVLDEAVRAGLVTAPTDGPRYTMAHALVAQTLYHAIPAGQRRRLHRAVAAAINAACQDDPGTRIGEVAHHVIEGAGSEDAPGAIDYARRAGDRAQAQIAPEEAERWYQRGLELVSHLERPQGLRCELGVLLGTAQRDSGNPAFRATLLDAAHIAQSEGREDLLISAALANTRGFVSATGEVDTERITVLEAALATHAETQIGARARLLALLAAELTFAGDWQRRIALSDEALALARQTADPLTIQDVLSARFMTLWAPGTLAERRANTEEALTMTERHGDPLARFRALHWRAVTSIEVGEAEEAARLVAAEVRLADDLRQPTARWLAAYDRATQALIAGDLDEAERTAQEAGVIARDSGQPEADAFLVGQLLNIRFEQGRLMELEPLIATQVQANPGIPAFRAALALARADGDLLDGAREMLQLDAADGFSGFPHDSNWLVGLVIYAEACVLAQDAAPAAQLHGLLEAWEDQIAFNSATAWGSVARHVGNLDALLGHPDQAERRLRRAAESHERMGAPIWLARTQVDLARVLAGTGRDQDEARGLLQAAVGTAAERGAGGVARRAQRLLEQIT